MTLHQCGLCSHLYDDTAEPTAWAQLTNDWACPICGSDKNQFAPTGLPTTTTAPAPAAPADDYLAQWARPADDHETHMADIHQIAHSGQSVTEPMSTTVPTAAWDDILIMGAQLARLPLNKDEPVNTQTIIGPAAAQPLVIETPIYVTHMSFGALSEEAKTALAQGSAAAQTAICSGEGGILPAELNHAYRYIFEYVPNKYSLTDEHLARVHAVEIKIGQSAKPGMGGHLPGHKVTEQIAAIRGFPPGADITSPARFPDIATPEDLKSTVADLRTRTQGKPIGIKIAAGHLEADLAVALAAQPDFITIDGRAGATASAPKFVKAAASVPTIFALHRARKFLDQQGADQVSLLITGGLRISSDFAKALALGADAVALGTAAMIACGCQQYRICHTGNCPVGITTHDPQLRARLNIEKSAQRLQNFLNVSTNELRAFARLTGHQDVHQLSLADLCTTNSEISNHTAVPHV